MQEGGERCREAESTERWGDVQGGFQKCRKCKDREAERLEGVQAEVQGGWKLVRDGSSINTEVKGGWRECIEVHKAGERRRTRKDHLRGQRYNELQAKE